MAKPTSQALTRDARSSSADGSRADAAASVTCPLRPIAESHPAKDAAAASNSSSTSVTSTPNSKPANTRRAARAARIRYATPTTAVVASQCGQPRRSSGWRMGWTMITSTAASARGATISRANHSAASTATTAISVSMLRVLGDGCAGAPLASTKPP